MSGADPGFCNGGGGGLDYVRLSTVRLRRTALSENVEFWTQLWGLSPNAPQTRSATACDLYSYYGRVKLFINTDGLNEVREELDEPERLLGMEDSDGKGVVWSEDDIIKDADDHAAARFRRQAVASDSSLWPDGQIPYTISGRPRYITSYFIFLPTAVCVIEYLFCCLFLFVYLPMGFFSRLSPTSETILSLHIVDNDFIPYLYFGGLEK